MQEWLRMTDGLKP